MVCKGGCGGEVRDYELLIHTKKKEEHIKKKDINKKLKLKTILKTFNI